MKEQIVPGYVTLGTTWSTSEVTGGNDGGTFGGIDFTGRPTEITFMYKRELGEEGNTQPATVVVYLWKGTYTQKDVPGNISGAPTVVDMIDRDRAILDMATEVGGEVTESDDAELIGKAIVKIEDVTSEWKQGKVTIEYLSDATPEHINVIFAANDYFGDAADIEAGNSLTIDNVYCVYGDTENTGEEYNGQLEVEMDGDSLTDEPVNTSIFITENTDGTFTFLLPDLTLGDIGSVGDIKLDGVTRTTTDGVDTYTCHDPALSLLDGELEADVTLNGTVDGKGAASFVIDVVWMGMPIKCTFNGQGAAAINGIEIDSANAPVEFYNLNGVRVSGDALAPGIYIRRQGNDVKKILVR
ncbi:MAG: calycin-like domain-containing protein [Paramuribaculum sp.]|nr:calycin-like domain-containing protein [Paramuribaculum sp.]